MAASGWLISCASVEAISPNSLRRASRASSFCTSRSRASVSSRSVRSRMKPVKKVSPAELASPTVSFMGKVEPSFLRPTTTRSMPMIRFSPVSRWCRM